MAKNNYRIVIPTDAKEYQTLINDIDKKNDELGDKSPLADKTDEIKQGVKDMAEAARLDKKASDLKSEAEKLILQRNILMKTNTLPNERGWRKTVEGKNIKNIQGMSDWGYQIDRSKRDKGGDAPAK